MPILGILASQITGHLSTNSYESIQTVTVGSGGQSSISFTSIPQTYKHLQIRGIAQTAQSGSSDSYGLVQFNSTDLTYQHSLWGSGATVYAENAANVGRFALLPMAGVPYIYSGFVMDILDYANTSKNKTHRTLYGYDKNSAGNVGLYSGFLNSTTAISSLTFYTTGNNGFTQYTQLALYGVK
jgi:hypothetical protein